MRIRTFAALLAIVLVAWPVAAQEQRGSIEGVVKDTSGAVLPGVTVEAKSAGGGVLSAVSDASGNYRFPSLLPGIYEVTANLSGFKPAKVGDIEIKLGSIKKVDFGMQLAGVTDYRLEIAAHDERSREMSREALATYLGGPAR